MRSPTRAGIAVLLVDDDETWARTQRRTLERAHDTISVTTAHGLVDARGALLAEPPDCIVCDYQLGDGTGLELLAEVREVRPEVPFVIVTGQGDERVASDAIGERVTDYVRKADVARRPTLLAQRIDALVATDRAERAVRRERRSKEALLGMLTAGSTRREFTRRICASLVDEDGYAHAWIGVPGEEGALTPLAAAGATDYLDATLDHETERLPADEPAARAFADARPVTVASIAADQPAEDGPRDAPAPASSDWRAAARRAGFASAAAVPIGHDGIRYGAIAVYAAADAVPDHDHELLDAYATTVGYALKTATWRETLLSSHDRRVEIALDDASAPLVALSSALPRTATVTATTVVPRNDAEALYLATVAGASVADLRAAVAAAPAVLSVDVYGADDPIRCGLVVTTPVPEAVAVEAGGRFERTAVEGGRARLSLVTSPSGSVGGLTDAVGNAFDGVSVTTVRSDHGDEPAARTDPTASLTDRQRQVLEVALEAGYFERPRTTNTGELAASLDVSRATVTQHLRAAERKVFTRLLRDSAG
ncbi:response regulator [Halorubrum sp. JWXQ-INN 858]|nr:response regulator [Halorubrum sp. JWXQ-INN 858]